jgi:hypothetical protein
MIKLSDLSPRWIKHFDTDKIGFTFLCPHCKEVRLAVHFWPPIDPDNHFNNVVFVNDLKDIRKWTRTGNSFENLSLSPSIDTSAHGHWHGSIINGEII